MSIFNESSVTVNEFDSKGRIVAKFGTPIIDGKIDPIWGTALPYSPQYKTGNPTASAFFRVLWDEGAIYILAEIESDNLSSSSAIPYMQDSIEIFLAEQNSDSRENLQFRVNYQNCKTTDKGDAKRFYTSSRQTESGYIIETRIGLKNRAKNGRIMGIEIQVNDAAGNQRAGTLNMFDSTGTVWNNLDLLGEIILLGKKEEDKSGLNPYDMINLLKTTATIKPSIYKNYSIVQEEIEKQYNSMLEVIDKLEHTEAASNEKWFRATPMEYKTAAKKEGNIEKLEYNVVTENGDTDTKHLNVYLPYGYDKGLRYNILYLMHGMGENENTIIGGPNDKKELKAIIDNMIAKQDIEPLIIVTPTFYGGKGPKDFPQELLYQIIPLVENRYSTYAVTTDEEGLEASRAHRGFGGFSMGAMTTWRIFAKCLNLFKYYIPLAGGAALPDSPRSDPTKVVDYLATWVKKYGYAWNDFYLFCANGTRDMTMRGMEPQIKVMKESETFIYSSDLNKGNFYFMLVEGGTHTWYWVNQYLYNILPDLFRV